MDKLTKNFADILHKQDFCFTPSERRIVNWAISTLGRWEYQSRGCSGCVHIDDQKFNCEKCMRYPRFDFYQDI